MEMVVNGVSTQKVEHITRELCGEEFPKSTVSELGKGLDPVVTTWNERPLSEIEFDSDNQLLKIKNKQIENSTPFPLSLGVKRR